MNLSFADCVPIDIARLKLANIRCLVFAVWFEMNQFEPLRFRIFQSLLPGVAVELTECSVLIVDDVEFNRRMIAGFLQSKGCIVRTAINGEDAIESARTTEFQVILMDVSLPGIDGLEATRQIRQLPDSSAASAWIVAVSAHASEQDRLSFLQAGMDDCLAKPIDLEELAWMMQQQAGSPRDATPDSRPVDSAAGWEVLDVAGALKRIGFNRELYLTMIQIYREDVPLLMKRMEPVTDDQNRNRMADVAHRIRGIAANLGALALADAATRMEQAGQSLSADAANQLLNEMKKEIVRLETKLNEFLQR